MRRDEERDPLTAVVVPIRSFDGALSRLEGVLDGAQRRELMMLMAGRVVAAAGNLQVYVATDDAEVAQWARGLGAEVIGSGGRAGLTAEVTAAVERLGSMGFERVVVAHADLVRARSLNPGVGRGLTIVPDLARDGSNVVCVPTWAGFRFSYGPGSFGRHVAEARRLGLEVTVVEDAELAADVDEPDDLRHLPDEHCRALGLEPAAGESGGAEALAMCR